MATIELERSRAMNAEKIVKELRWLSENDEWVYAAETMAKAADLIDSMQAQLAEAQRRAEKAVEMVRKLDGCSQCMYYEYESDWYSGPCDECNEYEKWKWRYDAEEGDE